MAKITNGSEAVIQRSQTIQWQRKQTGYQKPSFKEVRQYTGRKNKDKMTNNNLQNIIQNTKDRAS